MCAHMLRKMVMVAMLVGLLVGMPRVAAADVVSPALILNEYNCVDGDEFLDGADSGKSDTFFGRVMGNGDNWIELVVVEDHADLRGYELLWLENDGDGNGTYVWDDAHYLDNQSQGKIIFSDAALWSDLRGGTIITISDKQTVDTEYENGTEVEFDLSTDTSYDPLAGDWTIHMSSRQEAGQANPLVTTLTNVDGDPAGAFSVGNSDWEMRITDGTTTVFGPIGEMGGGVFGGISGKEVGKLEADPTAFVDNDNFNDGTSSTFGAPNQWSGGDEVQDFSALRAAVPEPTAVAMLLAGLAAFGFLRRR
ncbi:MAG: PEP-CTERM sorting domain-containing protein [Pirellulales bacterium]|nr:PEP-CTERM sorting domain-containing protein [Pirellulales bacterium]